MAHAHGQFIWHELITSDVDGAKAFYSRITPWGTRPHEGSTYTMWTSASTPIGGLLALEPDLVSRGVPAHWLPYVSAYDVDAIVHQVPSLGGKVLMPPREISTVGAWAVIADPQGAVLGIYEPEAKGPSSMKTDQRGDFSWHELMTTDSSVALDFYRTLFDWRSAGESDMGEMGTYRMFGVGVDAPPIGGMFDKPPNVPTPNWLSYIRVDDVAKTAAEIFAAGGRIVKAPMEVPGGDKIAVATDPQGVPFAIHASK